MIAARITFFGACKDAVDFYGKVFQATAENKSLFRDHHGRFPYTCLARKHGKTRLISLLI